jgi:hypothetical protein
MNGPTPALTNSAKITAAVRLIAQSFNDMTQAINMLIGQITPREIGVDQSIDDTYNGATLVDVVGVNVVFPALPDGITSPIFNLTIKNNTATTTTTLIFSTLVFLGPGQHARVKRMGSTWVIFGP